MKKYSIIPFVFLLMFTLLFALFFTVMSPRTIYAETTGRSTHTGDSTGAGVSKASGSDSHGKAVKSSMAGAIVNKRAAGISDSSAYKNVMHPEFPLLDNDGNVVTDASVKISSERSCSKCHDTRYINNHNLHYTERVKTGCITCHFEGSKMSGDFTKAYLKVQLPSDNNCAYCHGVVHTGSEPLTIPGYYTWSHLDYSRGKYFANFTRNTGVIISHQNLSDSALNIKDKKTRDFPWDVHARRQLKCISCHFTKNDPRNGGAIGSSLDHLLRDPRRVKPPHQYLMRPDHELNSASCTGCHNPLAVHKNLPYKKRHMDVLSCQSCHVPQLFGPAFKSVDHTVVTRKGAAGLEYRGTDQSKSHGVSLNTMYINGFKPFLFPHKKKNLNNATASDTEARIISPFNLITTWAWKSKKTGAPVPLKLLKSIYLKEGHFAPDVLRTFDSNKNNSIDADELRLDSGEKIALIKGKLVAHGIEDPVIFGRIDAYKINHGVLRAKQMTRDCAACHNAAAGSKFGGDVVLAGHAPGGIIPEFAEDPLLSPVIDGEVTVNAEGVVILKRPSSVSGHYVFGHGRIKIVDQVGLLLFILSLLFAIGHGGLRYLSSRKHQGHIAKTETVYMYGFYERLWHWTMAVGIMALALTGLEIHYTGSFALFGLARAVLLHNLLAYILVINAALSLFYHLATGEIKQFFGFNRKFIKEIIVQAFYYIHGIFKGAPHPISKSVERKLNPLQQLTYVGMLNILLPFQVISGVLMMGVNKWPQLSEKFGGLAYLGPLHNLGSWLFLSFLAVHIYLTSTGHTVLGNTRAMITGYDEVEMGHSDEAHAHLMDMRLMDLVGTLLGNITKKELEEHEAHDGLNGHSGHNGQSGLDGQSGPGEQNGGKNDG